MSNHLDDSTLDINGSPMLAARDNAVPDPVLCAVQYSEGAILPDEIEFLNFNGSRLMVRRIDQSHVVLCVFDVSAAMLEEDSWLSMIAF